MKEFFAIALSLLMLFSFGIEIDFGDNYNFPDWVDCILHPQRESAIDMTIEPLYQFSKTHLVPLFKQ